MTIIELANEYQHTADNIKKKITQTRERLKTAKGKELYYCRVNLKVLSDMYRETKSTAERLRGYYEK